MAIRGGETDAIRDALDSLFELGEIESLERTADDAACSRNLPGRLTVDVPPRDAEPGSPVSIPAEKTAFASELERTFEAVEALLGLRPGQSKSRVFAFSVLSEERIEELLDADESHDEIKPDQADPILGRLPAFAKAGELAHALPSKPAIARTKRLALANQTLRGRADRVVRRKTQRFMLQPTRLFASAAKDSSPQSLGLIEDAIEEWIEACADLLAGPHGHWDRDGRWPACLMLLQAMSLSCAAALGKRGAPRELAEIAAQLDLPCFKFLHKSARSFRSTLKSLNIDLDAARRLATSEFSAQRATLSA